MSDPKVPKARGHKQKGAGTVVHDRPAIVTNDGVVLKCKLIHLIPLDIRN